MVVAANEHADLVVSLVDKLVRNSHQGDRGLMPAGHAMNVNFPRYELGQSGSLRWRMADEGTAAVAAPFFVMDLSTSSTAQSVGLGNMRLPGVSVNIVGREDPAKWRFPDLNELWSGLSHAPW